MFGQLHQIGPTGPAVDFFGDNSGVSLFRFEGNLNDDSGTYNGTYNSGNVGIAYSSSIKKFGTQSLTLTQIGGNSYNHNPVSITNDAMGAVSYWAYLSSTPADDSAIFNLNFNREAQTTAFIRTSTTHSSIGRALGTGAWKHIVITKSGSNVIIYINDTEFNKTFTNGGDLTVNNISISRNTDAPKFFIDHVRFFNRGLSSSEVTQLYNETE